MKVAIAILAAKFRAMKRVDVIGGGGRRDIGLDDGSSQAAGWTNER